MIVKVIQDGKSEEIVVDDASVVEVLCKPHHVVDIIRWGGTKIKVTEEPTYGR